MVLWRPSFWWETRAHLPCSDSQDHLLAFPLGSFSDALIFLKTDHFPTIPLGTALSAFLLSPCNLSFWMLLPLPSLPPSGSPSIWGQAMRDHHSPWLLAFVFFSFHLHFKMCLKLFLCAAVLFFSSFKSAIKPAISSCPEDLTPAIVSRFFRSREEIIWNPVWG